MGIFDLFRKNNNKKIEKSYNDTHGDETKNNDLKLQAPIQEIKTNDKMYKGIEVDGDYLTKVYSNNIINGTFIVPKHIKAIGMFAFSRLNNLKTIIMHDEVRYISPFAFNLCENLTEVKGLENAETMKHFNGFNTCCNLRKITLPNNIQSIDYNAFNNCKNLTSINLPEGCFIIGIRAFNNCESLQSIEIPSSMEYIDIAAFAGCKNLTITFLEDNKKYFHDYIKELEEIEELEEKYKNFDYEIDDEREPDVTDEEMERAFNDLGIKHRKINIEGEEILWPSGKLIIKQDALAGVKEVIAYSQETIDTIIKSGYKGKITYVNREDQQAITIDVGEIENQKKRLINKARENYYKQTLIPKNGTTDWLTNCKTNNYNHQGYKDKTICKIPITFDCYIEIKDYTQPKSNSYVKEYEEFFTSVDFYKTYDNIYTIYYPFGARFDVNLLTEIGKALNELVDKYRSLSDSEENKAELLKNKMAQKQLIEIFVKGTNNRNIVSEIMSNIYKPKQTEENEKFNNNGDDKII